MDRCRTECAPLSARLTSLKPRRGSRVAGYVYEIPGDLLTACRATHCYAVARELGSPRHQEDARCMVMRAALSRDITLRGKRRGEVVGEVWLQHLPA